MVRIQCAELAVSGQSCRIETLNECGTFHTKTRTAAATTANLRYLARPSIQASGWSGTTRTGDSFETQREEY